MDNIYFDFHWSTYHHIDTLSNLFYNQHGRFHSVSHMSFLHTHDYMCYHTCLRTVLVSIPLYSSHCFCYTLLRNSALGTVNNMYLPNNQTYSWYSIQFYYHRSARHNLEGIAIHKQVPSIRVHIHWYSYQNHHKYYFCKFSHILKLIK